MKTLPIFWLSLMITFFLGACSSSQVFLGENDDLYFNPKKDTRTTLAISSSQTSNGTLTPATQPTPFYVSPLVKTDATTFRNDSYSASPYWQSPIETYETTQRTRNFGGSIFTGIVDFAFQGLFSSSLFNRRNRWYYGNTGNWQDNTIDNTDVKPSVTRPREERSSYIEPRENNNNFNMPRQNFNNNTYSEPTYTPTENTKPTNYEIAPRGNSRSESGGSSTPSNNSSRPRSPR